MLILFLQPSCLFCHTHTAAVYRLLAEAPRSGLAEDVWRAQSKRPMEAQTIPIPLPPIAGHAHPFGGAGPSEPAGSYRMRFALALATPLALTGQVVCITLPRKGDQSRQPCLAYGIKRLQCIRKHYRAGMSAWGFA